MNSDNIAMVFDDDGILHVRMVGSITAADAERLQPMFDAVLAGRGITGNVRILADIKDARPADTDARRLIMGHIKRNEITHYAIWGIPAYREVFMRAYFKVSGIRNYRVFRREQDALAWLLEQ